MSRVLTWVRKLRVGSPTRKSVMWVLADHADIRSWSTTAGQELIAAEAELSLSTVKRAMAELEEMGLISRERRYRRDGTRTSDRTTLNRFWQPPGDGDPTAALPVTVTPSPEGPTATPWPVDDPTSEVTLTPTTGAVDNGGQVSPCTNLGVTVTGHRRTPRGTPREIPSLTAVVDLSSRARRPDDPPPPADRRVLAACQLLAAHDLAQRRGASHQHDRLAPVHHQHAWHTAATRRRLDHHGQALAEHAARQPSATARQLAALIEPHAAPAPPWPSPWLSPTSAPAHPQPAPPPADHAVVAAQAAAWRALHRARLTA